MSLENAESLISSICELVGAYANKQNIERMSAQLSFGDMHLDQGLELRGLRSNT